MLGNTFGIIIKIFLLSGNKFTENKNITRRDDQLPYLKYRTDVTISKVKFIQNIVSYCIKKPLYLKRGFWGD